MYVCVYVCVCVFGSVPSNQLIADWELETEKKQNEAKFKRGRVYYEKIKDHTRLSLPMVFVFLCLAEVVSVFFFPLSLFLLDITVSIHLPIFSDSSPNCLHGFHMELSWNCFHHVSHPPHPPPQKTINVYGFVYGFGAQNHKRRLWKTINGPLQEEAFMVFHKRCLWSWAQNHKRRLWKTINAASSECFPFT